MQTLDQLTNAPRELTLAGAVYTVSALTLAEWGALQLWLRTNARDPVVAAVESLNRARESGVEVAPEDRKALLEQARIEAKAWPPRVASGAWLELLTETEGASAAFLKAVLRKHQPALADAEIERVNRESTPEESQELINRAMGYVPAPKAEGASAAATADPHPGPTPTTGANSSTTSS